MEGWSREARAIFPLLAPEWFESTPVKTEYDSLAPNPKNWTEPGDKNQSARQPGF